MYWSLSTGWKFATVDITILFLADLVTFLLQLGFFTNPPS